MKHQRRERVVVLVAVVLAGLFVAGSCAAPLLGGSGGFWLRLAYAPLCHQMAERSIEVGSTTQALCARCCGLYVGGWLGLLTAALLLVGRTWRPHRSWLAWAILPSALDFALGWLGVPDLPNLPRLLLAIPAGLVIGWFLALGLAELSRELGDPAPVPRRSAARA